MPSRMGRFFPTLAATAKNSSSIPSILLRRTINAISSKRLHATTMSTASSSIGCASTTTTWTWEARRAPGSRRVLVSIQSVLIFQRTTLNARNGMPGVQCRLLATSSDCVPRSTRSSPARVGSLHSATGIRRGGTGPRAVLGRLGISVAHGLLQGLGTSATMDRSHVAAADCQQSEPRSDYPRIRRRLDPRGWPRNLARNQQDVAGYHDAFLVFVRQVDKRCVGADRSALAGLRSLLMPILVNARRRSNIPADTHSVRFEQHGPWISAFPLLHHLLPVSA